MKTHSIARSQLSTHWLGIAAIAALYGAFTFAWVNYRIHLPSLMAQFQFTADAAPKLLLIETLLAIGLEPLLGQASDRMAQRQGTRWPLIALGVVLAAALLLATLAWVMVVAPNSVGQWGLLGLLIGWAIAMSIFRSPAVALLGQSAATRNLPLATSGLTFAGGIAGSIAPLAKQVVLDVGAVAAFSLSAGLLLAAAAAVRSNVPAVLERQFEAVVRHPLPRCLIFAMGFAVTLAFRLAIDTFPKLLKAQLPQVNPALFVGAVFLAIALAAVPAGRFAVRSGHRRALLLGLWGGAACLGGMAFIPNTGMAMLVAIGFGICFSVILNGVLPLALMLVPSQQAGLGVGLFFGGGAAAASLLGGLALLIDFPTIAAVGLGAIALLAASLCIAASVAEPA